MKIEKRLSILLHNSIWSQRMYEFQHKATKVQDKK